uniref:BZIP domain-containing protein n=2 Tax=Hemiselmis andersenii TaxID=464988 RepID=A0A7S1DWM3_HEMAN|mmetsp:Transcript_28091/g.68800  ORF Transcript_28091/g.68800 Transcript_28091/m.68800 type:complete len:143 (+) Transcript_28091:311-739(+)
MDDSSAPMEQDEEAQHSSSDDTTAPSSRSTTPSCTLMEAPAPPAPAPAPTPSSRRSAPKAPAPATAETPDLSCVAKGQKGLAYDLDKVDDKLRKRLLKNRQSAERSRQRKLAEKSVKEQEICGLREENARLKELLKMHGIAF